MRKIACASAVATLLLSSGTAMAQEMTVGRAVAAKGIQATTEVNLPLIGMINGLTWANSFSRARGAEPLYCQPDNLSLTTDQVLQILRDAIGDRPEVAYQPLALGVIMELNNVFPCR